MELCLGTVQFGMDYGIRGKKKPALSDALELLDYALHNGIDMIDTASAYGSAEDVVGCYLDAHKPESGRFQLISKLRPNVLDDVPTEQYYPVMKANLEESLRRLHTDYLDGYLLHSARYVFQDEIIAALTQLKKEGSVRHVGVSVYEVEEAEKGISRRDLDFLQLPFSILDQRMLHRGVLALAEKHKFPLHTRSAFIQGLVMMQPEEVPPFLREKAAPILRAVGEICRETGLSRTQLAIGFVKRQTAVNRLVFGVRDLEQLQEDLAVFQRDLADELVQELEKRFDHIMPDIVMPSLWKKEE